MSIILSILSDSVAISEYLEEAYAKEHPLIGEGLTQRAEVRRLVAWFDTRFGQEVSQRLLFEKIIKRYLPTTTGPSGPDSTAIRQAKNSIHHHLDYISWLVDRRNWLAGDHFSLADITAAAHLSVVDYLGDVPWESHLLAKEWYARIKSRPIFRSLLQDRASGLTPSVHYADFYNYATHNYIYNYATHNCMYLLISWDSYEKLYLMPGSCLLFCNQQSLLWCVSKSVK